MSTYVFIDYNIIESFFCQIEIKESVGKNSIRYIVSSIELRKKKKRKIKDSIELRKTEEKKNGKTKAIQR